MLFQSIQNGRHISVFIAGVKGQIKNFFIRHFGIVSVILCQIFGGGIGYRRFTFLLKAQPPVAVCGNLGSFRLEMVYSYSAEMTKEVCGDKKHAYFNNSYVFGFVLHRKPQKIFP